MTSWLHEQRLAAVHGAVRAGAARSVLDLGCGDGDLLIRLAREPQIARLVGIDLSQDALTRLRARLARLARGDGEAGPQIELICGSMTRADRRLCGFDCAILVETIEHLHPAELSALERAVFGTMRPGRVVVTTPNAEFNTLLGVPTHRFRHPGHRFEWGRAKFGAWASGLAGRNDYAWVCSDIAGNHPSCGGASQMAVFTRIG
ncbi:MAG: methyltransferase domain-containing protein [Pseudorhodobacter sp.]|nr:methyltransferase domain-containing protein [Pseudorhodobacter sp.]